MALRKDCLPCADIGGFLSVPTVVRSPVVKNATAAYLWKSLESKTRPSLVQVTLKPCLLPSDVIACSTMLSLPPTRFTTSCSHPDDLVKTRTDFFVPAKMCEGRAALAATTAPLLTN